LLSVIKLKEQGMDEPLRVQIEPVVVDTARRQADQALDRITRRRSVEIDFDDKNYVRKLGAITGQADEFSKSMEAANARVLAFGASVGVINAISNVFKNLISSTVEVEKSLTEIRIIGNETFRDLSKASAGVFANAKQLGVSYKDAADATLEFARQGKGLNESLDAGRAALALTRTSGIAATEAVLGLTSAVNAFGRGADAYIEYANKMSSVSDAFAVNNKDLIEGISRSASVAQEAGVSFEELVALITTLQEKTGRGGAVIGNSLKTIFTRVQNPEIIKDLRDLGIVVQDEVTGNILSATKIIQNLAQEFGGFDKNLKNSVLLKVGGGFQVDKFSALMNDVKSASGTFQQSFAMASSGSGNILGRVAELNKTIDGSFTNILTSSKQLGSNIGQVAFSKDFIRLLETGSSLINSINDAIFGNGDEEDKGSAFAKGILKGIGSVISGPGLALFAGIIGKLVVDFSKFSATGIQTLIGITSKTKEEESLQRSIATVLSGNFDFQQKIFSLEGNKVRQAELLLNVYRDQADQVQRISSLSKEIAPMLREQGVSVSSGVPEVNKAASGYVPNLASAIAQEKAQSPAGSRIIVDNNFPMGGGKISTMVYNSNETRVKNFAGSGGDAIIPNYPINSAKGYTPNFAGESSGKTLAIDGSQASVAGLTFAGKTQGIMEKAKSMPIDEALLEKYKGSPFIDLLKQFERINLVNIPVGSVYKFRKGLRGEEDTFKQDFVSKLNSKFRSKFVEFISEEISELGLTNGGGVGENLKNLKLDVFNSSTAGYVFEDILKIPTLTNAEKVAQYKSQSETEFFDMQNLQSNFAKEYGLPDKNFKYVEIKLGEGELHDGITKKFLNQAILEGGSADPKKFGVRAKRAASGYIPNFANLGIAAYQPVMAGRVFEALVKKQNYVDLLENSTNPDFGEYEIKGSVKAALSDENFGYGRSKGRKLIVPGDADKSLLDQLKKEKFAEVTFSRITNKDTQPIARAMIDKYGDPKYIGSLNNLPLIYPKNKSYVKAAAKGYIPNFSELSGSGAGMLYQDPNFNELGGGQSGKFLAPKSGEGFGQKIFYKTGSDKINQEYQVNKSIKDFEKENPALFAKNAISFTNVGKLLTKNGLTAGFEREVIGGLGVDEFATGSFSKGGAISPKTNFAFYLSELLAQAGVKNVVGEYRGKYGQNSLSIDDVYAQNFKVNDIMQKLLIDETNQFFRGKKNAKDSDVDNYIRSLRGNPLVNSLNEKFGSAGGRHTMFDTQGFAKNASKGYVPNFANVNADILTANPMISETSLDEFVNKYLGQNYSTGLSGTSANVKKLVNPSLAAQAKRDFIMSMLGVNFLATFNRDKDANLSRKSLMDAKTKTGSRNEYVPGGFMQQAGNYTKSDYTNVIEGAFSGKVKELKYEELDSRAEKIFSDTGLSSVWNNDIINTLMQVAEKHSQSEMAGGNFQYRGSKEYKKVKAATGILRPALINGLLEGEKGVQGLLLNTPEADKSVVGKDSKYLALLDPNAANLQKYISDFLINPNREPLDANSSEAQQNLMNASDLVRTLDTYSPNAYGRKPIRLNALKEARDKARSNAQLRTFFGETAGAFQPIRKGADGSLGTTFKSSFPQEVIDRMTNVLTSTVNRKGIFQLSNLDFGYAGTPEEAFEFKKGQDVDTFKNSPSFNAPQSSVAYGEYKNNKAYYDSIAKWKYDPATKSMARQAAKGYIPNFAGGAIIQSLKEKAKKLIRNPIAQTLFDQAVETLLGLPEGFESSEIIKQINFALTTTDPSIELGNIRRSKAAEKRKAKRQDYLSRNAYNGYTPNFSKTAINEAVMREQMQSGLPSSQISVTQDSRLANNLNPSGFAVINKRDEPNGKVPNDRISGAYKKASRGFIPNFTTGPNAIQSLTNASQTQGGIVTAQQQAVAAASANATAAQVSTTTNQKKLSEQVLEYISSLNLSEREQNKVLASMLRYERILDDSSNLTQQRLRIISNSLRTNTNLSQSQSSGLNAVLGLANTQTQPANPQATNTQATNASNTRQEEAKKKATKSLGDLAQTAFVFQSGISFATGAISSLGKEAEALGNVLNTLGQIGYTLTQGNDLFKAVSGGRGFGESVVGAFNGIATPGRRSAGVAAITNLGSGGRAALAEELGLSPELSTVARNRALRGAISGGGGMVAGAGGVAATAGIAAGILAGGYLLYKSVDEVGKLLNGSVKRTENAINGFNAVQEKYNITLTEAQRKTVEGFVDVADVSTTSLSGIFTKMGLGFGSSYRALKAGVGLKDERYQTEIQQSLGAGNLNLGAEGTKQFGAALFPLLQPLISNSTGATVNGVFKPANQDVQGNELARILPKYTNRFTKLRDEYQPSPADIQDYISKYNPMETVVGQGSLGVGPSIYYKEATPERAQEIAIKALKEQNSLTFALSKLSEEIYGTSLAEQDILENKIKGSLLVTEEFKKQLEVRIQSARIDTAYASELENVISARKELSSLDDAEKFSLETKLKSLQEERKTRGEIKNLLLESSKETIFKSVDKTNALGIPKKQADEINSLFQSAETAGPEKVLGIYENIVKQQNLGVKQTEKARSILQLQIDDLQSILDCQIDTSGENEKQLSTLKIQLEANKTNSIILVAQLKTFEAKLKLIKDESAAREKDNAQQALYKTITEKTNFYFNLRKEILSSTLEIQNKSLQRQKEQLSLAKETRDVDFQRSQFLNAPKRSQAQNEYEGAINAAKENRQASLDALSQRQKDVALQNKQAIFNEISSRAGNDINLINRASSANNQGELQKVLEDALVKQGGTFEDKVIAAAKEFYRITTGAAVDSKAGTPDQNIIAQADAATKLAGEMQKSGSVKGVEDRIAELNKKGTSESIVEAMALENRLKELKEAAATMYRARTTQAPDEKTTKQNADTRFTTEKEIADLTKYKKETAGGGIMEAYEQLKNETDSFGNTMGKTIPLSFRDGMTSAMKELANTNSTEPLKNRLLGVANSFLQKIQDGLMQNLASQVTKPLISGIGSFTEGAGMAGAAYASGGYIKGGSGSKDDVPAMLMGGEYVVTKSAVQKYGPSFLDSLNKGTIKKFANGGWVESDVTKYQDPASVNPYGQRRDQGLSFNENGSVIGMDSYTGTAENKQNAMMRAQSDYYAQNAQTGQGGFYMPGENGMGAIMGQRNLLSFATQQTAGTQFDKTSGSGNSASVDLGAGSSNMSLFALRDQGNSKNAAYLESKQKSLDLYFGGIDAAKEKANREEEIRKEQERIKEEAKKQEKAMIKGILTSIATSAAMAGIGALGDAASKGWSATNQASGGTATFGEKAKGAFTGGTMGGETRGGMFNAFSSSGYKDFSVIGSNTGQGLYQWDKKGGYYNEMSPNTFGGKYGSISDAGKLKYDKLGTPYVSNRRAAGGYVAGNGMGDNVPAMLNGGEFVVSKQAAQNIGANKLQQINSGVTSDSSELIAAKLDELVEKLSAVGTLNITVNSDSKGGQQSKEEGGNQDRETKELARRIKEVVMVVLKDEKRLGGMLR
jgi:TP901 family phage tail tape measure protein